MSFSCGQGTYSDNGTEHLYFWPLIYDTTEYYCHKFKYLQIPALKFYLIHETYVGWNQEWGAWNQEWKPWSYLPLHSQQHLRKIYPCPVRLSTYIALGPIHIQTYCAPVHIILHVVTHSTCTLLYLGHVPSLWQSVLHYTDATSVAGHFPYYTTCIYRALRTSERRPLINFDPSFATDGFPWPVYITEFLSLQPCSSPCSMDSLLLSE